MPNELQKQLRQAMRENNRKAIKKLRKQIKQAETHDKGRDSKG